MIIEVLDIETNKIVATIKINIDENSEPIIESNDLKLKEALNKLIHEPINLLSSETVENAVMVKSHRYQLGTKDFYKVFVNECGYGLSKMLGKSFQAKIVSMN